MSLLGAYLLIGVGVYLGVAASHMETFNGASTFSIIKGAVLGFLLWPVGLAIVSYNSKENKS